MRHLTPSELMMICHIFQETMLIKNTPEDIFLKELIKGMSFEIRYYSDEFNQKLIDRVLFYRFMGLSFKLIEAIQETIYYQNSKHKWENQGKEQS